MSSLLSAWGLLDTTGQRHGGFVRLRLGEVKNCATYAARSVVDQLEAVVLDVSTKSIPGDAEALDARGLSMRAEALAPGPNGRTRIVLAVADPRYRALFQTLAADVVSEMIDADSEKDAVARFVARLARWRSFLRIHGNESLSREGRRGLVGELLFLRNHVLAFPGLADPIGSWKGCRGAHHDFQFLGGSVEVKATASSNPRSFHVSSIPQLDMPDQHRLFIYFVALEESESGEFSLADLVDSLRDAVGASSLDAFDECLFHAGYLTDHSESYATPRYWLKQERFFRVDESFPRLLQERIPDGVDTVRYEVALAACTPFGVVAAEVVQALFGAGGSVE
ncbi:MAG: PD-(D/E)XK motif protein [Myxococcota bacterium]